MDPMPYSLLPSVLSCVLIATLSAAKAELVLVNEGQARAGIVLADDADAAERAAAEELREHIRQITGVQLPLVRTAAELDGRAGIYVGRSADDALVDRARKAGDHPEAFALVVGPSGISLRGVTSAGTLHAAYELLERMGVRWFMPGELGTVVPRTNTLTLEGQQTAQAPGFTSRRVSGLERTWAQRLRLGGEAAASTLRMPNIGSVQQQPELFALVNGRRHAGQLCVSNPQVVEAVAQQMREFFGQRRGATWFAIGSHGGGHCECDGCRGMDPVGRFGPYTNDINVSDRYVAFANAVLALVASDLPDKRLALTIASPHMLPPITQRGHRQLDVVAWSVGYCRFHGVNNPICPERAMVFQRIQAWAERLDGQYYEKGGEWGNVACPGLLFPMVHRFRIEMPAYRAAGLPGFTVATYSNWISDLPSAYIGAKLMWNPAADVDALLADFYHRYYGPAAEVMGQWHQLFDAAVRDADFHTGSALDMPHIYTPELRSRARALLAQAAKLAEGEPACARRIHAMVLALDYLDAFVLMLQYRDVHDYSRANAALDRARQACEQLLTGFDIPLLGRNARGYLDRFFGRIIEQAHERVGDGDGFVAGADDQWQFQIDPQHIGQDLGWWRPTVTGGNWQTIRAYSTSWSNQGLRYYRGHAWYRQTIRIGEEFRGQKIMLWCGNVDSQARVWLNGILLGDSEVGPFQPFELDATDAVRFGQDNVLVIRTDTPAQVEVGTGGLMAPVMFYRAR
jgi:hypothetical protein